MLREEKEKEKETALRAQSKQWSQLLADIKPSKKKSDGGSYSATAKRPKQSGSKISDLERRQNQIRSVVTQQLRKGEGNETEIARNIERMRRIEDRKKKKMRQIERTEFDHFCRAKRRYLQSRVLREIQTQNEQNLAQRKRLYKALIKENKEKHCRMVARRDSLQLIRSKHLQKFKTIVLRERKSRERTKAAAPAKETKAAKKKRPKETKPPPRRAQDTANSGKSSKSQSPAAPKRQSKYSPPKRDPLRTANADSGTPNGVRKGSNSNTTNSNSSAPPKMTFAMKMAARRQQQSNHGALGSNSGASSFASRFSRDNGPMDGPRNSFRERPPQRPRMGFNDNGGGGRIIRPKRANE